MMHAKRVAALEVILAPVTSRQRMLGGDGAARELTFDVGMLQED
jgi:hypothetical protein